MRAKYVLGFASQPEDISPRMSSRTLRIQIPESSGALGVVGGG